METPFKHIAVILLMMVSPVWLLAQDSTLSGKTVSWDLARCIDYAKKNNILINSLRLSQQISRQQFLLAKAARLPNLSGSAQQDFTHQGGSGTHASGAYGISSSITLYNGSLINNTISQANLSVESANFNIMQTENDITLQITQAYLNVLLDKENIVYQTDLVSTTRAQVSLEQEKYKAGAVARYALIQLQAQQSGDEYTLVTEQNTEKNDLLTLKQLMLLPADVYFDIVKPDTIALADTITPFRTAERIALQTRPEVKAGELGVKIAQYNVDIARSGYKPVLLLGGSLGTSYLTDNGGAGSQLNNNFNQQAGLTLSVPILTRRQVKTQVEEAQINTEQAGLNLSDTRITLSQAVERAYLNVLNARSQYAAALEQYKNNQEGYRIASEQLKVGAINTVDFLVQKNLFVQAQQAWLQAKYNQLLSLKIYDFYRGVPIKL